MLTSGAVGLLFIDHRGEKHANLVNRGDAIDVYIRCAANCARSFRRFGHDFCLATNAVDIVKQRLAALSLGTLNLREVKFKREVPRSLGFASAHYKLELLEKFGEGDFGDRPLLVDLDTELVRQFPKELAAQGSFWAYDITSYEHASYGRGRVDSGIAAVAGKPMPNSRWWGGEFFLGDQASFAKVSAQFAKLWPIYVDCAHDLFHQGDEVLTSVAINLCAHDGFVVRDAGKAEALVRWWSARTRVPMPPFAAVAGRSLMHLPADKNFLAARAGRDPDPILFTADYRKAIIGKLRGRHVANYFDRLTNRSRKFVPRLR